MEETYRPWERIRRKRDFESLYHKGIRYKANYFIFIYHFNDLNFSRMSAVVSKKHGNAVRRNKIKRQLRVLFRRNKNFINKPIDCLIIPRKEYGRAAWPLIELDYKRTLHQISRKTETQ